MNNNHLFMNPYGYSFEPQSESVSGAVYPASVVVENRTTYFDHEERIKQLERQIVALSNNRYDPEIQSDCSASNIQLLIRSLQRRRTDI